jgi:hypothetical protein
MKNTPKKRKKVLKFIVEILEHYNANETITYHEGKMLKELIKNHPINEWL